MLIFLYRDVLPPQTPILSEVVLPPSACVVTGDTVSGNCFLGAVPSRCQEGKYIYSLLSGTREKERKTWRCQAHIAHAKPQGLIPGSLWSSEQNRVLLGVAPKQANIHKFPCRPSRTFSSILQTLVLLGQQSAMRQAREV